MAKIEAETMVREAKKDDLMKIKSLLESVFLPSVDIDNHIFNFIVLENAGNLIGTIGMEIYNDKALLRSLAVSKECQNEGYGKNFAVS